MIIAIIGLGRMGVAQSRLARAFGDNIILGIDTSSQACQWFQNAFNVPAVQSPDAQNLKNFWQNLDLIWITVTDAEIQKAAHQIAPYIAPKTTVLHTSGALSSQILMDALPHNHCGSLHPLVACPLRDVTDAQCVQHYQKVLHTFEGHPDAKKVAETLCLRIHAPLAQISPEKKSLYHAGAVFASNYPLMLVDIARHLFEQCGFAPDTALDAARHLLAQTTQSAQIASPVDALTGPVKRRDTQTIQKHLDVLADQPELLRIYRNLCDYAQKMVGCDLDV